MIFGEFNLPLGYGFSLTGLGGILGINRRADSDALREVLFAGRFDNLLFPGPNALTNLDQILNDMAAIYPVAENNHLFGPIARIAWGTPALIDLTLGVILEVGQQFRLLIVGKLGCNLPTKENALIALNLSFAGEIDFVAGEIGFDATLQGSRVLGLPITGDAAIRTGWAPGLTHIAAFGGLHPNYPSPDGLPQLRRLGISFPGNNPQFSLSAYLAVTLDSLQFGARASLDYNLSIGSFAAEISGLASFDALIHFDPFQFEVTLCGALTVSLGPYDLIAIDAKDLKITGPNGYRISGNVKIKAFFTFEKEINFSVGRREHVTVQAANPADVLRKAIENTGLEQVGNTYLAPGVTFRELENDERVYDPAGRFQLSQRNVPLNISLEKLGTSRVQGSDEVGLRIGKWSGNDSLGTEPVFSSFVEGHFFSISEAEQLRGEPFAEFESGVAFGEDGWVVDDATAMIDSNDEYEILQIGEEDAPSTITKAAAYKLISLYDRFDRSRGPVGELPVAYLRKFLPEQKDSPKIKLAAPSRGPSSFKGSTKQTSGRLATRGALAISRVKNDKYNVLDYVTK